MIRLQFEIRNMQLAKNEKRLSCRLSKMHLSALVDRKLGMVIVECDENKIKTLFIQKEIEKENCQIHSCRQLFKE